jgi:two-component sensor histidine kinase
VDPATGRIRHFTTADGLASGTFLCAYRDQSGAIWLGMTGGLSRLVPSPDPPAAPPPVFINSLVVGTTGEPVSAIGSDRVALGEVASGDNRLQIDFVGLSFAPGESLRYEYQLEGADHGWNPPSDHRSVNYANLAPGRYRFLVRARTADGVASAVPAEVTFVILRPWWQRWWFIGTVLMVMAVVAQWGYRTRMARLVELANVRARIALDLHDDIGSNLTKIAILSEVARQQQPGADTPDGPLSSIARISRESVAAMSDIVWAINPHRDRLLDLVRRMRKHAEEVLSSRGVKVSFNAPADNLDVKLGVDVRRDLFLIFKEAINNVARHAVPTRVDIVLQADRPMLRLLITDDGRGFDPGLRVEGDGLVSMRHRAQRLGGSLDVRSAAGLGTTIEARLPMRATRRHNDPHEHVGNRDPEPR